MLADGVPPALIDNVGRMTGMPRGPLEMNDDVALDLSYKIGQQTKKDLGDKYVEPKFAPVLEKMVVELGRLGRKNGKGFYDYPAEKGRQEEAVARPEGPRPKPTKSDLNAESPAYKAQADHLKQRLLHRQALEAARCFEENVITDPREADVGAILGWGFAPWTGGPISYIDGIGVKAFTEQCEALAAQYGSRFTPPGPPQGHGR